MQRLLNLVLLESTPNDLLSLYLIDNKIKRKLNSKLFLNLLNKKHKVKATTFLDFFSQINIKKIQFKHEKTLYLYRLEDSLYKPLTKHKDRYNTLLKLYQFKNKLKISDQIFGLAVTLYDLYIHKSLLTATVCLYLSAALLEEYINPRDYQKLTKVTKKTFVNNEIDIVKFLDGMLIRPSTILFNNHPLSLLSYFSDKLLQFKPSLIAETVNYMTTGKYKIYTLTEMSDPCKILKSLVKSMSKINEFKKLIKLIKYPCEEKNKAIEQLIVSRPKLFRIGQFKKLEVLGEGIEGQVYKIKNIKNKTFALKKVKNITYGSIEVSMLKICAHDSIIQLADFNIKKDVELYLELGKVNLYTAINKRLLPLPITTYIKQLLSAINYCHYNDIIHRDLKPENIIFDGKVLKVIDFGISVPYSSFKTYLEPDVGTITYDAPEKLLGSIHYTNKVDIWALGVIFYFMIVKETLIDPFVNNHLQIIKSIFSYFGKPTKKTWPEAFGLPKWKLVNKLNYRGRPAYLQKKLKTHYLLISKCLVLNPNKRFSASELLHYHK